MEKVRLKISFLLPSKGVGGSVRAIVRFGNELIKRGHDVRVFYRNNQRAGRDSIRRLLVRWQYGEEHDWLVDFKGQSFEYNALNPHDFSSDELIVSMCAQTTLDAWALPKNVGIKILHCHGPETENWEKMLDTWKLPMPKIVVSSYISGMMQKEVAQAAIGIAPDGVDSEEYYPCVSESHRDGIGGAFRWRWSKDPASTIRIMRLLKEELPEVPLYSYGNGRKPKEFKSVLYHRLPDISKARELYSKSRVWFLASIDEGFGLPVLEAMACGCVVVSTDCGGPRDVIKDGVNGFLVDVGNTGAMVHKIKMIYNDDALRHQMCQNAMQTVKEFTWGNGALKLEGYLSSLCHRLN